MRAWHNFLKMEKHEYKVVPGKTYFHCAKCDSVVLYPNTATEREVNQIYDKSKLVCIPKNVN